MVEIAKTMIEQGFDDSNITLLTKLSAEQIQALREKIGIGDE
jgi:2-keto-3-deoxy-6-phosphogluconate aldolase